MRRQLNDVQRARVGEKIATRSQAQGQPKEVGHMADLPSEVVPTQDEVAKLLNVSTRQVGRLVWIRND